MADEIIVVTPGGPRSSAYVHEVPARGEVRRNDDEKWVVRDHNGQVVVGPLSQGLMAQAGMPSGWEVSAYTDPGCEVATLSATWDVPANPAIATPQTVYLFPAIQSAVFEIVQPVLTWDRTVNSKGSWWIASWMVTASGHAFRTKPISVVTGQSLEGRLTAAASGGFDCEFVGSPGSLATFVPTDASYGSYVVLESYNRALCSQYPNQKETVFKVDATHVDGQGCTKNIWAPQYAAGPCGSSATTAVVSGGTKVRLAYYS